MQIRTISADNFKSLVWFRLDLAKFTCLVGLNGAGKSTVLQFLDFLAQQVRGDIEGWLSERSWEAKDLRSQLTGRRQTIEFHVQLTDESGQTAQWSATFNPSLRRCTQEQVIVGNAHLIVAGGTVRVGEGPPDDLPAQDVAFTYEGSILSQLKESTLPAPLVAFKRFFLSTESLDLLSPELLRQRTRDSGGSLGLGGQRLSAFLHELGTSQRRELVQRLKSIYPKLQDVSTKALRSGWKQLTIDEMYPGEASGIIPAMTTEVRHVADGMLRLIAILAEIQTEHRVLLFDEIENGINPELVEFVLDSLISAPQQVLVTTHSPLILNYLDDEIAREGVIYLYKTARGHTNAVRFFDIPSVAEKLTVMGPGEAFADTDLSALREEIEAIAEGH